MGIDKGIYFKDSGRKNCDIDENALAGIYGYNEKWSDLDDNDKMTIMEKLLDKHYGNFVVYGESLGIEVLFVLYNLLNIVRNQSK